MPECSALSHLGYRLSTPPPVKARLKLRHLRLLVRSHTPDLSGQGHNATSDRRGLAAIRAENP
jgi:hypothetical protein